MHRSILLLPACLAFAAIAGCGNKGPLYYPPPTHAALSPAPAPAPAQPSSAPASASSVATKPVGANQ
ncbi:LPS translocon maturation chaperone LptM [Dyella flagellata]|nr:lipoprotein [Dyella flagellata]